MFAERSQRTVVRAYAVLRVEDVALDPALLKEPQALHHLIKPEPTALIRPAVVIQLARTM